MFIIFFKFHDGVTNTVQHFLVGRLLVMSFDLSCVSQHCCDDCCLSVYYNGTIG